MNPLHHLNRLDIILGSASPRRHELFAALALDFRVVISEMDEIVPLHIKPADVALYLSQFKSNNIRRELNGQFLLITADTIVLFENQILGKPSDQDEAFNMIRQLQGATHQVITGVTIASATQTVSFDDITEVGLSPMSDHEIQWYIANSSVMDKAGSYGIQDWIGVCKINLLKGSYYNVMGLPTHKLYEQLMSWPKL